MKFFGIPITYIVIAVGILGIVTYSYVSYNKPAFVADDTLKCQRQYDFSQIKFTTEAKQDWDKCYMPQPLYERRQNGQVICLDYPEETCIWCSVTIALKYNSSNYCDLITSCNTYVDAERQREFVTPIFSYCRNTTLGLEFNYPYALFDRALVDHNIINEQRVSIYSDFINKTEKIRNQIYFPFN